MRKNRITKCGGELSILAVDDDPIMTLTIQSYFQSAEYAVDTENDPVAAVERVRNGSYDILLMDFLMSPIYGDEVVSRIRVFNKDIYIVLLTGYKSLAPPIRTIRELDIQGYYEKSERFDQLELLIESCAKSIRQMRTIREYRDELEKANAEIKGAYERLNVAYLEITRTLRSMVDARDIYTRGHSDRVSYYAVRIAEQMNVDAATLERIRIAGLFHDVGKIGVPDEILKKSGKLSADEYEVIKRHSARGYEILSEVSMFKDIALIVAAHHERVDGRGYPENLIFDSIPLEARVISVADSFDAMTSHRRYRDDLSLDDAIAELTRGKGTQFDPDVVDAFLPQLSDFDAMREQLAWTYTDAITPTNEGGESNND